MYVVEDKAVGLFRHAADIRVALNSSGILSFILIWFPEGVDYESLVSELTDALGAPTVQYSGTIDDVQTIDVAWDNRIASLTLSRVRRQTAEWRTSLLLVDPRIPSF
ncbi:MAG: hypothetical protein JSV86_06830 [Gemmatimonadota bacterium]|nr:MAG: hypothetical protein JSV86_06830 [Gemmatimonadota bacterium]